MIGTFDYTKKKGTRGGKKPGEHGTGKMVRREIVGKRAWEDEYIERVRRGGVLPISRSSRMKGKRHHRRSRGVGKDRRRGSSWKLQFNLHRQRKGKRTARILGKKILLLRF